MPGTFGPRSRLRDHKAFVVVQKTGRRVATPYLTMLGLPNQLASDRLGIIASKRLGGAVSRNRAKRRLREIFRATGPDAPRAAGGTYVDIVAIPKRGVIDGPFDAIDADFRAALRRFRG